MSKKTQTLKELKRQLQKFFNENHTIKGVKIEIQLKEDAKLIQQKGRPIPIHLQQLVEKEKATLKSQVHIEKANDIDEYCFVIPVLLFTDRFRKWPASNYCTSTDGETAVKLLEQYIRLNGILKTIRTDKATAFTGRLFREFGRRHYIKLIYGTP